MTWSKIYDKVNHGIRMNHCKNMPNKKTFNDILKLAEKLRSPTGCPWDRKQTILSMLKNLEEEAEEVCEAAKKNDMKNLEEELGDVLFQIVMITQIAKENKLFNMDGVLKNIHAKITSRHTWVFGKDKAKTPEEAIAMWLKNKEKEKKGKMLAPQGGARAVKK